MSDFRVKAVDSAVSTAASGNSSNTFVKLHLAKVLESSSSSWLLIVFDAGESFRRTITHSILDRDVEYASSSLIVYLIRDTSTLQ